MLTSKSFSILLNLCILMILTRNIAYLNDYFENHRIPLNLEYNEKSQIVFIREHHAFFLNQNMKMKKWLKNNLNAEFQSKFQWHIKDLTKIRSKNVKVSSSNSKDDLMMKMNLFLERIEEITLKDSLIRLLTKYNTELIRFPASLYSHHCYNLGLLEHIVQCLEVADTILSNHQDIQADYDLIIAGIILHDMGKVKTYEYRDKSLIFNEKGKQLGHISLSAQITSEEIVSDKKDKLLHIIQSHHYDLSANISPTNPQFNEAWIVFIVDTISSKLMG